MMVTVVALLPEVAGTGRVHSLHGLREAVL